MGGRPGDWSPTRPPNWAGGDDADVAPSSSLSTQASVPNSGDPVNAAACGECLGLGDQGPPSALGGTRMGEDLAGS
jgi:hypothetical protein